MLNLRTDCTRIVGLALFFFLMFPGSRTKAQLNVQEHCMSEINWKRLNILDPGTAERRESLESDISRIINSSARSKDDRTYVIPVVVHVIYQTDNQNVSDGKINTQIDQLNRDFANLNDGAPTESDPFGSVAADMRIEFKLAELDPRLRPTNGITRTPTNIAEFEVNGGIKFKSEGGVDAWNPKQYLNFWVCNLGGGVAGYASFPSELTEYPLYDGIVVDYGYFGNNRLATHEVGHWLNLRHIWGDEECGDDMVIDTPKHEKPNYSCPKYPHNIDGPCNVNSDGEMFMNFMDYADNQCTTMFTKGQRDRAHATLKGARKDILTSTGLILDASSDVIVNQDVSLFPNPSRGYFRINLDSEYNQLPKINVYDLIGNKMFFNQQSNADHSIDIELMNFKPGTHLIVMEYGNTVITKKISLRY